MPGTPRLQGRMGCGVRKRRGVQAALGTYPGARPLRNGRRSFIGTERSKPHDMGARLIGQPPGAPLAPRMCRLLYGSRTAQLARPTHPPEKSMSERVRRGSSDARPRLARFQTKHQGPIARPAYTTKSHLISALHRHTNRKGKAMVGRQGKGTEGGAAYCKRVVINVAEHLGTRSLGYAV